MKDFTIILEEILEKEKYERLFNYTIKNVREKFGDIKADKGMEILIVNHQILLIISFLKAQDYNDNKISEIIHWKKKNSFKYLLTDTYYEFVKLYEEYIGLIVSFIKNNNQGGLV